MGITHDHRDLGRRGEWLAERYLRKHGLKVLGRNWRCPAGELDLIATDGKRLIFYEVKTRGGTGYGSPAEAVTEDKARRIRRLSRLWRDASHVQLQDTRYDIISVLWPPGGVPRIEHLAGAF